MTNNRRNWIVALSGILVVFMLGFYLFLPRGSCCRPPPVTVVMVTEIDKDDLSTSVAVALTQTQKATLSTTTPDQTQSAKLMPTGTPRPTLPTRTPCPSTDDICQPRTSTISPQQEVYVMMASAEGTEYAQLALTATALATSPTPSDLSATPTLCPPNDGSINCPGGSETLTPKQRIVMLMASAEGTLLYRYALTATALETNSTPTLTPNASNTLCGFTWAHQDLPDVAQAAREAFDVAVQKTITVVRAEAFGESCGSSFGAMSTDFYLSASVTNLNDNDELEQVVISAYKTLTALQVQLPAAPGYLDITFDTGKQSKHFRAMFQQIKSSLDAGEHGADLLAVGGL